MDPKHLMRLIRAAGSQPARIGALAHGLRRHGLARLGGRPCWSAVTLLVTFRCDCRCAYCDFPRHAGRELETAEILRLLTALRRAGTVHLGISGGEPLLRPDLEIILRAARRLGFLISLTTNGLGLPERPTALDGVDYVLFTVEGTPALQDEAKGVGAYEKVLAAIHAAREHSRARVGIICPVYEGNHAAVEHPLALAESLNIRVYYQPVQQRQGWEGHPLEGTLTLARRQQVFGDIRRWKRQGRPVGNSHRYLNRICAGEVYGATGDCAAGRYFVTILPDGRVAPCCMVPFDDRCPRVDLDDPMATAARLPRASCGGCTIAPYVENSQLFSLDLSSWIDVLGWTPSSRG